MTGSVSGPDGLAVVDKPAGWTSHDVVAKARKLLGTRKVGHSGTLDPDATGILLLGVGRVTRLLRFLTVLPKTYEAEVVFGIETSTLDASGEVLVTHDMTGLRIEQVREAAARFVGEIDQIPPMVSAVRVGGRRLHELAREGREVEREPRRVAVYRFDVEPGSGPGIFRIEVECSSGTYVRSLAADLGQALGGGAHLRALRRTRIGSFELDEAVELGDAIATDALPLLKPVAALRDYPRLVVDGEVAGDVRHGKVLPRSLLAAEGDGPWGVVSGDGDLLAVYQAHRGELVKPAVVLSP